MITLKIIIRRSFAKRTPDKDWSYFCKKSCKFREICNACCGDKIDADPFYNHCETKYISDFIIIEVRNG
jgi:hypothetical protein